MLFILWEKVLANYVERGGGETGLFILKLFTLGIVDGAKFRERKQSLRQLERAGGGIHTVCREAQNFVEGQGKHQRGFYNYQLV